VSDADFGFVGSEEAPYLIQMIVYGFRWATEDSLWIVEDMANNLEKATAESLITSEQRKDLINALWMNAKAALEKSYPNKIESLNHVAADGNCLFSAIADQLTDGSTDKYVPLLRRLVMDEIRDSTEGYNFTEEGNKEGYIEKYRQNSTYGGDNEIKALSKVLNRRIIELQIGINNTILEIFHDPEVNNTRSPIYILFYGPDYKHYNSVRTNDISYPLAKPLPVGRDNNTLPDHK